MKPAYLIVSGDFVKHGGMNQPNYELAAYLAEEGFETHLVGYRAAQGLSRHANAHFHRVPKPAGSYFLAQPLLNFYGHRWARALDRRAARIIINGTCSDWHDVNWVHHVQAAFAPQVTAGWAYRLKYRVQRRIDLAAERKLIPRARIAITTTEHVKRDIVERLGFPPGRAHVVYLGIDPSIFRPPLAEERTAARSRLRDGIPVARPMVAFVGALGDTRKGFDTLFSAWTRLCRDSSWDADLVVVAQGGELPGWKARAAAAGIAARIRFVNFDSDEAFVARMLWGCDALVLPSRYEGYGRPVQEALCCGVPALVSRASGISEQYPADLNDLVIPNPEDAEDLAARLARWRASADTWRDRIRPLAAVLRAHTWRRMARQMVEIIEASGSASSAPRGAIPPVCAA